MILTKFILLESAGIALSRFVSSITKKDRKNILRDEYSWSDRNYPKTDFSKLDNEGIYQQAKNLCKGVPMATPVFDGDCEGDVREILKLADLSSNFLIIFFIILILNYSFF